MVHSVPYQWCSHAYTFPLVVKDSSFEGWCLQKNLHWCSPCRCLIGIVSCHCFGFINTAEIRRRKGTSEKTMKKRTLSAVGRKNRNHLWKPTPGTMERREKMEWLASCVGLTSGDAGCRVRGWHRAEGTSSAASAALRGCSGYSLCHHLKVAYPPSLCCCPHLKMGIVNNSTPLSGRRSRNSWDFLPERKRQQQTFSFASEPSVSLSSKLSVPFW